MALDAKRSELDDIERKLNQERNAEAARLNAAYNAQIAALNASHQAGMESVATGRVTVDQAKKTLEDAHAKNHAPKLLEVINDCYETIAKCCEWSEAKIRQAPNANALKAECEELIHNNHHLRTSYKAGNYDAIKNHMVVKKEPQGREERP